MCVLAAVVLCMLLVLVVKVLEVNQSLSNIYIEKTTHKLAKSLKSAKNQIEVKWFGGLS